MNPIVRSSLFTIVITFFAVVSVIESRAQEEKDSVEKKSLTKKALNEGLKLITVTPKRDTSLTQESTEPYLEYAGKIIRNITIRKFGFETSIYDTTKRIKKTVTQIANALHVDTRENTIRQHLFVEKYERLNPYKVADNERFLRDRDFILDSRILVVPVEGTDSVDLLVITRDVFSLGATFGGSFPDAPEIGIYDANVNGRAQRLEVTTLIDGTRDPKTGVSLLYRKSSLFGSLVNLEVGYTELNEGRSIGRENEYAFITRLTRPLVSPYTRWAGGIEVSRNWSKNVYNDPDTAFLHYKYNILDTWVGYNFGINRAVTNRNRHFLAFRYFDGTYLNQPDQPEYRESLDYNNSVGYLSEFTFYRQNYYRTRYVFGFGRTEDVPYGLSLGVTGGYLRQLGLGRPYGAVKLNFGEVSKAGNFYRVLFQTGGYVRNNSFEDAVVQVGATYFSRLWELKRYKMRNSLSATYAQIFNRKIIDWLDVGKKEIPGFDIDSLNADKRFSTHFETIIYTPWSLLGFRFAPFVAVDFVNTTCKDCEDKEQMFWGFSSGFRTRNENLIFGTIEVKFTFIPNDGSDSSKFVIGFKENIRVKNSGTFIRPPSPVQYN